MACFCSYIRSWSIFHLWSQFHLGCWSLSELIWSGAVVSDPHQAGLTRLERAESEETGVGRWSAKLSNRTTSITETTASTDSNSNNNKIIHDKNVKAFWNLKNFYNHSTNDNKNTSRINKSSTTWTPTSFLKINFNQQEQQRQQQQQKQQREQQQRKHQQRDQEEKKKNNNNTDNIEAFWTSTQDNFITIKQLSAAFNGKLTWKSFFEAFDSMKSFTHVPENKIDYFANDVAHSRAQCQGALNFSLVLWFALQWALVTLVWLIVGFGHPWIRIIWWFTLYRIHTSSIRSFACYFSSIKSSKYGDKQAHAVHVYQNKTNQLDHP